MSQTRLYESLKKAQNHCSNVLVTYLIFLSGEVYLCILPRALIYHFCISIFVVFFYNFFLIKCILRLVEIPSSSTIVVDKIIEQGNISGAVNPMIRLT